MSLLNLPYPATHDLSQNSQLITILCICYTDITTEEKLLQTHSNLIIQTVSYILIYNVDILSFFFHYEPGSRNTKQVGLIGKMLGFLRELAEEVLNELSLGEYINGYIFSHFYEVE